MTSSYFPVFSGRTSDAQVQSRTLYQVQMGKIGLERVQTQLSTGRKILVPSEDPSTSLRVLSLQREQELRTQAMGNLDSANSFLNATESTLASIQSTINDMRGLTVSVATNLNSDAQRDTIVSQIDSVLKLLIDKTNTKYQDRYLLAGSAVGTKPVTLNGTAVQFSGDEKDLLSIAGNGLLIPNNVTGQRALGLMSSAVTSTVDLAPAARPETSLQDLNGGNGVAPGAVHFTDGVDEVTVDLSSASTLNDVMMLINGKVKLGGRDIQVALQNNGTLRVQYADGASGILRIADVGTGKAASDLGIATSDPAPTLPIVGPPLDPILKLNTKLSQLNDGAGFDSSEGFRITQGDRTYTIVIGTAQTIEDVFNAVRRSGASIAPEITPDGRYIRFRSTESGTDFAIGENGGLLATRLGIRTLNASTRIDQLNHGRGITTTTGAEIAIRRNDGTQFSVDLTGAVTMQDVLDRINDNVANQTAGTKVTAALNSHGNGITLSSVLPAPGAPNPQPIAVSLVRGADAVWELGLIPPGQETAVGQVTAIDSRIVGVDPNPQEVKGIFNSMLRFRDAVQRGDQGAIARASKLLDEDLERLTSTQASLGVSLQQLDDIKANHEDRFNDLKDRESKLADVDFPAAIAELNGRQIAYEASLKLLAGTNRLNLFDFI